MVGVLEPRVGDGTYVTSLEPELLLTGMGFISDLLTGPSCWSSTRCGGSLSRLRPALLRPGLRSRFPALEQCLAEMDVAETTQAFIEADQEFHRVIVVASGNSTLASITRTCQAARSERVSGGR